MYCKNCGNLCEDNVSYCDNCGASLREEQQPAGDAPVQNQQSVGSAPVQNQQPVGSAPVQNQQPVGNASAQNQQPAPVQVVYQAASIPGKGLGVASLVLGIISLVTFCIVFVSVPLALIAFLLGLIGLIKRKRAGANGGAALGGLVCSCITLTILLVIVVFASSNTSFLNDFLGGFSESLYDIQGF